MNTTIYFPSLRKLYWAHIAKVRMFYCRFFTKDIFIECKMNPAILKIRHHAEDEVQ